MTNQKRWLKSSITCTSNANYFNSICSLRMKSHGKLKWEVQGLTERCLTGRELHSYVNGWEQGTGGKNWSYGHKLRCWGGMTGVYGSWEPNILITENARGRSEWKCGIVGKNRRRVLHQVRLLSVLVCYILLPCAYVCLIRFKQPRAQSSC